MSVESMCSCTDAFRRLALRMHSVGASPKRLWTDLGRATSVSKRRLEMPLILDIDELADRLPEMLAEVEAGHEVVLSRGTTPVARVSKEMPPPDREKVEAAIASILETRQRLPRTTAEEILEWRDEGRR